MDRNKAFETLKNFISETELCDMEKAEIFEMLRNKCEWMLDRMDGDVIVRAVSDEDGLGLAFDDANNDKIEIVLNEDGLVRGWLFTDEDDCGGVIFPCGADAVKFWNIIHGWKKINAYK